MRKRRLRKDALEGAASGCGGRGLSFELEPAIG